MKVAYLGPAGTYSEHALRDCALVAGCEAIPCHTIADVYAAAARRDVEFAVMPLENSLEGSVGATLDLLVGSTTLSICAEVILAIRHNLLAKPGMTMNDVSTVLSHPQALAQCQAFLRATLPNARLHATNSTAEAAQRAAAEHGCAAIGSTKAGILNGLALLAENIQDRDNNFTRFVVVGSKKAPPTGRDRTSIAFTLDRDRPGGLHGALGEFASRSVNLSRIESRPNKEALGLYIFFLDLEGHANEPSAAAALAALAPRTRNLWILGSYPRAD